MALFPRRIRGRYAMLSRQDDENSFIMFSGNRHYWSDPKILLRPAETWETVKVGNCGSPIETEAGWLVITHGVGPMRKYCIGAALLDLEDPTRVIGRLREPLLSTGDNEREGYVPNTVYSCGSLLHHNDLILPYAMSDRATAIASVPLDQLLASLETMKAIRQIVVDRRRVIMQRPRRQRNAQHAHDYGAKYRNAHGLLQGYGLLPTLRFDLSRKTPVSPEKAWPPALFRCAAHRSPLRLSPFVLRSSYFALPISNFPLSKLHTSPTSGPRHPSPTWTLPCRGKRVDCTRSGFAAASGAFLFLRLGRLAILDALRDVFADLENLHRSLDGFVQEKAQTNDQRLQMLRAGGILQHRNRLAA